jgi:translation initiation factor 1
MDLDFGNTVTVDSGIGSQMRSNKIHLRLQQQGRRALTIIQDLDEDLDFKRICKDMRKKFNCNGSVVKDEKMGEIIQLQGDQRDNVKEWLIKNEILSQKEATERLVVHG